MAPTTAHLLRDAVSQNPPALPTDHDTIRHYNLDRTTDTNRLLVLGLYRMVFMDIGIWPSQLDKWRRQGAMAENLERILNDDRRQVLLGHKKQSTSGNLGYYFFFQSNKDLFRGPLGESKPGCGNM